MDFIKCDYRFVCFNYLYLKIVLKTLKNSIRLLTIKFIKVRSKIRKKTPLFFFRLFQL